MRNSFSKLFEFKVLLLVLDLIGAIFLLSTLFFGFKIEGNLTEFQRGMITGALLLYILFVFLNWLNRKMNRGRGEI